MNKNELLQRLDSVCNALNNISVTGVNNAANLAGCYSVIQETMNKLGDYELVKNEKE